ncbi:SCO2322 family protein [Streptomyces sp. NPDC047072]|uniref:SCO2322 family protein n=1 Tax=Streptomyces sp. NPDC047072 TaxID=3154809 RepID=UPI0033CD238E
MTVRRTTATLLLALLVGAVCAAPAQAAGYRYWSFWDRTATTWTYATQGPSTAIPSDGDVQGFRFTVSEDSSDATKPRGETSFTKICGSAEAPDGRKRVALVLDFGTAADAPAGEKPPAARTECAVVPEDATTAEALAAVAKPLRYNTNALLCAIAGYPRAGCGEQVTAEKKQSDGGPSVGLFAGAAAVAVLGAAAVWQARRRRHV